MKVVILAGGFGTRIAEESHLIPKPMIEIGGRPILWHILKHYAHYGFDDFIICCGYKQQHIKGFFANYVRDASNLRFDLGENRVELLQSHSEAWRVTLVDTGLHTQTGGRISRIRPYLDEAPFFLTYGDGVSDIALDALLAFHTAHGRCATLSTIQPESRFGTLELAGEQVRSFREKSRGDAGWINAGFMVLETSVFDYIPAGDECIFEREPLEALAAAGELMAYRHDGFWQCMDTQRDKAKLEALWEGGEAPWKIWKD